MDPKNAARKAIVERVTIYKRSDYDEEFCDSVIEGHPEIWVAQISIREGLDQSSRHGVFFNSEQEAIEYANIHPVGSYFNVGGQERSKSEDASMAAAFSYMDDGYFPNAKCHTIMSSLPMEQLIKAGIFQRTGRISTLLYDGDLGGNGPVPVLSEMVLEFIGEKRISKLQERFGDNWEHAAAWVYGYVKFPHSSPAYISSAHDYNLFILHDELTAGYLLRDLEVLVNGIEIDAVIGRGVKSARKKAGEKGKAASSSARTKRRMALLEAMETFAKRNPDMIAFGDREIARLSLPKCVDADPTLWAQGRKQAGEYLDEIRRGEAGLEAKARYHALFPPETA